MRREVLVMCFLARRSRSRRRFKEWRKKDSSASDEKTSGDRPTDRPIRSPSRGVPCEALATAAAAATATGGSSLLTTVTVQHAAAAERASGAERAGYCPALSRTVVNSTGFGRSAKKKQAQVA